MNVRLTKEQKIKVKGSQDIYPIMQQILLRENKIARNKEHFWIIGLASNLQILFIELISLGTIKATLVEPMEVFSLALQKQAVRIVLVHNHPSGDVNPSIADMDITERMLAIGKFLKCPVEDHMVITETGYYSFLDTGHLERIQKETTYDLEFEQLDKLKKQLKMKELENRRISKDTKTEMAKSMILKGISSDLIQEITSISKKEIEKLKHQISKIKE